MIKKNDANQGSMVIFPESLCMQKLPSIDERKRILITVEKYV